MTSRFLFGREKMADFFLSRFLAAIDEIEFAVNLHIGHGEGGEVLPAARDGFVGKGDGVVVGDQVANDGEIADRTAPFEVIKGEPPVGDGVVQQGPRSRERLPYLRPLRLDRQRTGLRRCYQPVLG